MALVSFQDRSSFFEELDDLVASGRLTAAEAGRLAAAPRIYVPVREVLGYLGGLVVLVGVVWTTSAALKDASPMSIAALLYIAGAAITALAFWMQARFERGTNALGRRAGEVIELLGLAALAGAVGITLNEQGVRGEHIALWIAAPLLVYALGRISGIAFMQPMFNATVVVCAAWIAVIAATNALIDPSDTWSALIFTAAGFVLLAFSVSEPPFAFAPHTVGVITMIFGASAMNGADRSAWYTLFPLAVSAGLFLYAAASARIEVLLVAGISTTANVGILVGRAIESDVVSGLVVTAVGVALILASLKAVTSSRRSSPTSSSSASIQASPS